MFSSLCARETQRQQREGTVEGRMDGWRELVAYCVLEVKYDWLAHSWVNMPAPQLKSVNPMCTDMKLQTCCGCHMANIMVGWPGHSSNRRGWYKQTVYTKGFRVCVTLHVHVWMKHNMTWWKPAFLNICLRILNKHGKGANLTKDRQSHILLD